MRKNQLEATLSQGGETPDTGPIENHLQALATARNPPALALRMCTIRIEESGPTLRAFLARAADGEVLTDDEKTLVFRGLHVLGGARDTKSCALLLRLLRGPAADVEDVLGDAVAQSLSRIAAGMFDGDTDALLAAIVDRSIDEYARASLLGAATFLAWEGRIERERMRRFLEDFYHERPAEDGEYVWIAWLEAIARLGLRDLAPLVARAWEDRIPEDVLRFSHFEGDLAEAESAPDDADRLKRADLGYIDDVVEELAWTYRDDPVYDRDFVDVFWPSENEPAINPWRHVGRNDRCPCGSGRKFKKCCRPD